jgi:hypothetical protein
MITNAKVVATGTTATLDWGTPETRRQESYRLTPLDIVIYGQSPARWVQRPGPSSDDGVHRHELLRASLLAPGSVGARYVPTPKTYPALKKACPKCGSEHTADVCRKCNVPRVNTPTQKDWSPVATTCKRWTQDVVARGLTPVPRGLGDTNARILAAINADAHAQTVLEEARPLTLVEGDWENDAGARVPLRALVDVAPPENHELCGTLCTLLVVPDIHPAAWQNYVVRSGHHIQSIISRDLYTAATGEDISAQLWLLVESREPHLVGRRRSTPELDTLARQTADRLLEAIAFSRRWDLWPNFDPQCAGALPAWSETYLDDWMTQAGAGASGYWALEGVRNAEALATPIAAAAYCPSHVDSLPGAELAGAGSASGTARRTRPSAAR